MLTLADWIFAPGFFFICFIVFTVSSLALVGALFESDVAEMPAPVIAVLSVAAWPIFFLQAVFRILAQNQPALWFQIISPLLYGLVILFLNAVLQA